MGEVNAGARSREKSVLIWSFVQFFGAL